MASRSGAGPGGNRQQRPYEPPEEFPPLPIPRLPSLPSLRALGAERESRLGASSSPPPTGSRPPTRYWSAAAARRAERIRNLGDRAPSLDDLEQGNVEPWYSTATSMAARASARRAFRLHQLDAVSGTNASDNNRSAAQRRRYNWDDLDQSLDQSLDEANAELRRLLDMTNHINLMTPLLRSNMSPTNRPHDFPDDNVRSKRRKIDSHRLVPSFKGFRYGKYGQVEPGQLQMEIVSCDGGMFSNESSYSADNILKMDSSVYCTKGNRCNIVLRHQGATVFTLSELIIKAPAAMNYSHPVREGMVFVAMNQDDILSRTAQYQIQYVAPSSSRDRSASRNRGPYSDHHFHQSQQTTYDIRPRHVISIQHHDDGTTSTRVRRSPYSQHEQDCDCNDERSRRTPEMPQEFASNLPEFHVTTQCSDDEEEGFEMPHVLRRAPPNRIGSLPFETETSDSDDGAPTRRNPNMLGNPFLGHASASNDDDISFTESFHRQLHGASTSHNPSRDRSSRSLGEGGVSLSEAWDAHASATQEAVRAVGGELLIPHARFYIEKKKSKCTIRFDPPVSGRFILLKMWSSHHDPASNIDIQAVSARGFAGPRYFPSTELS